MILSDALQNAATEMLADGQAASAGRAARFLKALAHRDRLKVLCSLVDGERSVTEIERDVGASQSAISQHLARMREQGIVEARRTGRQILYKISDPLALQVISLLYDRFCGDSGPSARPVSGPSSDPLSGSS